MARTCGSCGEPVAADAITCPACGALLAAWESVSNPADAVAPDTLQPEPATQQTPPVTIAAPRMEPVIESVSTPTPPVVMPAPPVDAADSIADALADARRSLGMPEETIDSPIEIPDDETTSSDAPANALTVPSTPEPEPDPDPVIETQGTVITERAETPVANATPKGERLPPELRGRQLRERRWDVPREPVLPNLPPVPSKHAPAQRDDPRRTVNRPQADRQKPRQVASHAPRSTPPTVTSSRRRTAGPASTDLKDRLADWFDNLPEEAQTRLLFILPVVGVVLLILMAIIGWRLIVIVAIIAMLIVKYPPATGFVLRTLSDIANSGTRR